MKICVLLLFCIPFGIESEIPFSMFEGKCIGYSSQNNPSVVCDSVFVLWGK